ncbi:MAG: flagellar basal body L-ring protein FlgH [Rickettsiales bacterium]|jgi:flagellar L-ring protein precursor FlgH
MQHSKLLPILLISSVLSGCTSNALDKLDEIGKQPKMAEVVNPTEQASYRPMTWPMPETAPPPKQYANSLWQPGARAFFRDQRAARVGDILRVNVKIEDKAEVDNATERKRDTTDSLAAPALFGIQNKIAGFLPGKADPSKLISVTGGTNSKGNGSVKRKETIETQIAALITQVLPNGNFVIDGKQEVRINFEIREVSVKGVVRPEDIKSDNTIDSTQIAESRITYGGRGQLTDMQQPRWGNQVVEILSPF